MFGLTLLRPFAHHRHHFSELCRILNDFSGNHINLVAQLHHGCILVGDIAHIDTDMLLVRIANSLCTATIMVGHLVNHRHICQCRLHSKHGYHCDDYH